MNFTGMEMIFQGDGKQMNLLTSTKGLLEKISGIDMFMTSRVKDNLMSLKHSKE